MITVIKNFLKKYGTKQTFLCMFTLKKTMRTKLLSVGFSRTLDDPLADQKKLLFSILTENKDTEYGKKHRFGRIKSITEYQEMVPVVNYDTIEKDIYRVHKGEQNIFTQKPVVFFGTTSGTSGGAKLIPFTRNRRKVYRKELAVWMKYVRTLNPRLLMGKMLYLIGGEPQNIPKGVKLHGSASKYLLANTPLLLRRKIVPSIDAWNIEDYESRIRFIAKQALSTKNISQLGFPFPLEMIMFFEYIQHNWSLLLEELLLEGKKRTVARLQKLKNNKPITIWPKLASVSCIYTADSELYMQRLFGVIGKKLKVIDPGIYATETRLTFDVKNEGIAGLLAAHVTFFEFQRKVGDKLENPITIDKLERNQTYNVIITSVDGLYRYDMGDLVTVVRFEKRLPVVKFAGRNKYLSVKGECSPYLDVVFAANAAVAGKDFVTYTVIPDSNKYVVYVETKAKYSKTLAQQIAKKFDMHLQKNIFSYKEQRKRSLKTPEVRFLKKGFFNTVYMDRFAKRGETKSVNISQSKEFIQLLKKWEEK